MNLTPPSFSETTDLSHFLDGLRLAETAVRAGIARAWASGQQPADDFRGLYVSPEDVEQLLALEFGEWSWQSSPLSETEDEVTPQALFVEMQARFWEKTNDAIKQGVTPRLEQLRHTFGFSETELLLLLIILLLEVDSRFERIFAFLQDDITQKRPSVELLLNLLSGSFREKLALRNLFTQNGRLAKSHLIQFGSYGNIENPSRLQQYLFPAPHLIEHLLGNSQVDPQLNPSVTLSFAQSTERIRLSQAQTERLISLLHIEGNEPPLFILAGGYGTGKQEAAKLVADEQKRPLLTVQLAKLEADTLPHSFQLIQRDGRLLGAVLFLAGWEHILDKADSTAVLEQLQQYPHPILISSSAIWFPQNLARKRPIFTLSLPMPTYEMRLALWRILMPDVGVDLEPIASFFRFNAAQIEDAAATAQDIATQAQRSVTSEDIYTACRVHSNQNLATLATKIQPSKQWKDIVLPQDTEDQLREMVATVRFRPVVYETWGFQKKQKLGRGLNALFAGESGTGKTMAADIIANDLGLDLYKVDLSMLVSKYIGETEKNLDRIFTEAATSNAILFFDEADAIFGKRSEVRDSHDRYANIEVSYLLQRMEMYDGVVILATNLRANLDEAFTRRLHFATEFPFPKAADRQKIWKVNIPDEMPLANDVDFERLANQFEIAGGNIRNIIMAAAFLSAAAGEEQIGMRRLLHATRREFQKMGRLIKEPLFSLNGQGEKE